MSCQLFLPPECLFLPPQQVLVLPLPACDDLKCRVFSALADCYTLAGPGKGRELRAVLRTGRDLATAARAKGGPGWTAWTAHFSLHAAAAQAAAGEEKEACESAAAAGAAAAAAGDAHVHAACAACVAQLTLLRGEAATEAASGAEALATAAGSRELVVHTALLHLLALLGEGNFQAASDKADKLAASWGEGGEEGRGGSADAPTPLSPLSRAMLLLVRALHAASGQMQAPICIVESRPFSRFWSLFSHRCVPSATGPGPPSWAPLWRSWSGCWTLLRVRLRRGVSV